MPASPGTAARMRHMSPGRRQYPVLVCCGGEGRVFVNQRSATKEIYPGYWSIAFGGHVLAGESYDRAAEREIREETGLATRPALITTFKKRTADERENVKVYGVVADGDL